VKSSSLNWVVLVGIALAGVVAASAATALAARSAASPFELVLTSRYEALPPECFEGDALDKPQCFESISVGTFTSGVPFCGSGTTEDVGWFGGWPSSTVAGVVRRYTCADGSGSVTLSISNLLAEYRTGGWGQWAIVEGSGRYEGLRGKGTYTGELLGGDPENAATPMMFRTRSEGFADFDAVAPSIAFTSASATKLRSPRDAPAYLIRVSFSVRDDVQANPVAYRLKVAQSRIEIASKEGTSASGLVSTTLRVEPFRKGLRSVGLYLRASDPVGNEQLLNRSLRLPR
jgi:hypothetical protein